ncbi:MAG: phosphonoacetaldehyde reductase [Planctomycetes bacterium]|nr:phosphonoacetaldehyde reductase [Planctomycetota bacterium]
MPKDFVGFGALNEALLTWQTAGFRRILAVASHSSWNRFRDQGLQPLCARCEISVFSAFRPNPDIADITAGADQLRNFQPDLILALGGGSAIDVAKMMKVLAYAENGGETAPSGEGPPVAAVATTAGSGSEATQFAVYYRGEDKQSLAHPSLRPEYAVVDPELTYSLPPDQTAATGFDALAQAVEAYWASSTSAEAQHLAATAIRYILPNLYNAVTAPGPSSRYHMAQAAYLAGQAINHTRTTMPHALAYHLTKRYGLPHGSAVALTLPYFFVLNCDRRHPVVSPAGDDGHRRTMAGLVELLGQKTPEDCFHFWRNLLRACGLPVTFADIGLTDAEAMGQLVDSMNPERMQNHPVRLSRETLMDAFLTYA